MPGSLTSRIRQLGPSLRGLDRNSSAVPKDLECKPTDSSRSWRDSRTSLSSSTMNTIGTSCVLINHAPQSPEKSSRNVPSHSIVAGQRQETPPVDCIRCCNAKPRKASALGSKLKGGSLLTLTRFACLPACRCGLAKSCYPLL